MIEAARQWFRGRTPREQRLLMVAGVLAVVALVWASLLIGYNAWLSAHSRHADAVRRLADTERRIAEINAARADRPADLNAPIETLVRDRAATAGFVLSNVTPQVDNSVDISMASAKPAALFRWIATLEEQGLLVMRLSTTNNGDGTVLVAVTFKKRSG